MLRFSAPDRSRGILGKVIDAVNGQGQRATLKQEFETV